MWAAPHTPLEGPQLKELLESLRQNAAQPAIQTSDHANHPTHTQKDLEKITHVRVKRAKPGPLGHTYDGPFKIEERLGTTCIRIRVGSTAKGEPRFETQHWNNCKPAAVTQDTPEGVRDRPGRKPGGPQQEQQMETPPEGSMQTEDNVTDNGEPPLAKKDNTNTRC